MLRIRRGLAALTPGAVLFSLAGAFALVNYNQILVAFLTQFLSVLVAALLGGDPSEFFLNTLQTSET